MSFFKWLWILNTLHRTRLVLMKRAKKWRALLWMLANERLKERLNKMNEHCKANAANIYTDKIKLLLLYSRWIKLRVKIKNSVLACCREHLLSLHVWIKCNHKSSRECSCPFCLALALTPPPPFLPLFLPLMSLCLPLPASLTLSCYFSLPIFLSSPPSHLHFLFFCRILLPSLLFLSFSLCRTHWSCSKTLVCRLTHTLFVYYFFRLPITMCRIKT